MLAQRQAGVSPPRSTNKQIDDKKLKEIDAAYEELRKEWKEETLKVQVGGKEWEVRIERSMYCEMTRDGKRKFAYDRDMIVLNDVSHACGISRRALTVSNRLKRNDMEPILHSLKSGYRNTELFCITLEQFKELCVIEPDYQVVFDQIYPRGLTSEKPSKNSERNWQRVNLLSNMILAKHPRSHPDCGHHGPTGLYSLTDFRNSNPVSVIKPDHHHHLHFLDDVQAISLRDFLSAAYWSYTSNMKDLRTFLTARHIQILKDVRGQLPYDRAHHLPQEFLPLDGAMKLCREFWHFNLEAEIVNWRTSVKRLDPSSSAGVASSLDVEVGVSPSMNGYTFIEYTGSNFHLIPYGGGFTTVLQEPTTLKFNTRLARHQAYVATKHLFKGIEREWPHCTEVYHEGHQEICGQYVDFDTFSYVCKSCGLLSILESVQEWMKSASEKLPPFKKPDEHGSFPPRGEFYFRTWKNDENGKLCVIDERQSLPSQSQSSGQPRGRLEPKAEPSERPSLPLELAQSSNSNLQGTGNRPRGRPRKSGPHTLPQTSEQPSAPLELAPSSNSNPQRTGNQTFGQPRRSGTGAPAEPSGHSSLSERPSDTGKPSNSQRTQVLPQNQSGSGLGVRSPLSPSKRSWSQGRSDTTGAKRHLGSQETRSPLPNQPNQSSGRG